MPTYLQKGDQENTVGKIILSSINNAEKIGQPPAKELNWTLILHHTKHLTQND